MTMEKYKCAYLIYKLLMLWEAQTVIFQLHLTVILIKQLMFQSLPYYSPF